MIRRTEVVIGTINTDLGVFGAVMTPKGLARLTFPSEPLSLCQKWVDRWEPGATRLEDSGQLEGLAHQLCSYLRGELCRLELELDLRGTLFQLQVWAALQRISPGQVVTYAGLAEAIGRPTAIRAVGRANATNPIPIIVPCHRVIGSSGALVGYAGGLEMKRRLLSIEGIDLPGTVEPTTD